MNSADSPATKDAQMLAETYVKVSHEACLTQLNQLIKIRNLSTLEKVVLVDRLRTLLINNGIVIRRNPCL